MKLSFSSSVFTTLLVLMQNTRDAVAQATTSDTICISDTKVYTTKVNVVASELGYYMFEECGDIVNPTIGMEIGETYTFVQKDRSNFYHPLGFAYYPDGAHDDVNELEPGIANNDAANSCESTMSCPAPMYFLNDEYLGKYSNIPAVKPVTTGEDDFGLDVYEPEFFYPLADWTGQGEYKIMLNYSNDQYKEDIFYFCHIHQYMTGRIKLLKGGVPVNEEDSPPLEYEYDVPGEFDQKCGTYGLDAFQLPHKECPSKFVCMQEDNATEIEPSTKLFAGCIDAMNCHMLAGMTTKLSSDSKKALFMQQMIPHHQNAVNMAKSLLHLGTLDCPNLEEETSDCTLETILREIIVNQNFQIQAMQGILEAHEWPEKDDCEVLIDQHDDDHDHDDDKDKDHVDDKDKDHVDDKDKDHGDDHDSHDHDSHDSHDHGSHDHDDEKSGSPAFSYHQRAMVLSCSIFGGALVHALL